MKLFVNGGLPAGAPPKGSQQCTLNVVFFGGRTNLPTRQEDENVRS